MVLLRSAAVLKLFSAGICRIRQPLLDGAIDDMMRLSDIQVPSFLLAAASTGDIAWLAAQVLFFAWMCRAAADARARAAEAGTPPPCPSPSWAVLNFLIPFWRLFAPFGFMRRLASAYGVSLGAVPACVFFLLYILSVGLGDAGVAAAMTKVVLPLREDPELAESIACGYLPTAYLRLSNMFSMIQACILSPLAWMCARYLNAVESNRCGARTPSAGRACGLQVFPDEKPEDVKEGFGWPKSGKE